MDYQEEYDLLVKMIDDTQKQIANEPKDKLHLMCELDELQNDLAMLRYRQTPKKKVNRPWLEGYSFGERRSA